MVSEHRSSSQKNRPFKGHKRHAGPTKASQKGKVAETGPGPQRPEVTLRANRRNHANQVRNGKRDAQRANVRGGIPPPRHVVLVPGTPGVDLGKLKFGILSRCRHVAGDITSAWPATADIGFERQRATVYAPPRDLTSVLDAIAAADIALWVVSAGENVDALGEQFLAVTRTLGLPTVICVVQNLDKFMDANRASNEKKKWMGWAYNLFGVDTRIHADHDDREAIQLLRTLTSIKVKRPAYHDDRPHVLATAVTHRSNGDGTATLLVAGYVRGKTMTADQLVHIADVGTFQIDLIEGVKDPCPLAGGARGGTSRRTSMRDGMDTSAAAMVDGDENPHDYTVTLSAPTDDREPLEMTRDVDMMANEQTWPTEEELAEAEEREKRRKMRPKGMSSYQASWLVDEEEEGGSDYDDEEDEEDEMRDVDHSAGGGGGGGGGAAAAAAGGSQFDDAMGDSGDEGEGGDAESEYSADSDAEFGQDDEGDDAQALAKRKAEWEQFVERRRAAAENIKFPDEVDTPMDTTARKRFARYRGLKSFRTSTWDPKEQLPHDYARIFQFSAPALSRKIARKEAKSGAEVGRYVVLHVAGVPEAKAEMLSAGGRIVLVGGLLKHENRMSLMNFQLHRVGAIGDVVESRKPLVFFVGWRRFEASPLFSEAGHKGDKFKMLRYLMEGERAVASCYCPIAFAPAPIVVFRKMASGAHVLVATGSVIDANPDRIVLKRVVLSGFPLKVRKRKCVARWMFHNPDDIKYFKKIELRTKHGRRGHIREPVGTHGNMKCIFDRPVTQQDTIMLALYKRIFPHWHDPAALQIAP